MRKLTLLEATIGVLAIPTGQALAACTAPSYSSAMRKAIPTTGINQAQFSQALQLAASFVRCKAGTKPLALHPKLTTVAATHSQWMAKHAKLSHKSTVSGMQSMAIRLRSTGLRIGAGAENIAGFERYNFPAGAFTITNAATCKFKSQSGKPIPAHSYASLAETVVAGWMGSPGHRKNLLNRQYQHTGGGLGFDPKAQFCGRFYITQDYIKWHGPASEN